MLKTTTLTKLAEALSKLELIQEIDQLTAEVNNHRPISKEIQDRIFQKFRLDWNYNSNAIEGNKLTYGETVALLMHGVTAKGKPLKDHMDVKGHNEGINLLLDIVKSERDFTQNDIRSLHEIILVEAYSSKTVTSEGIPATRRINIGQYKTVPNHVKTPTGEMHYYASPAETPALIDELMDWYEAAKKNDNIHPFITASLFHHRFVSIHPFDDGNGRMTRILMNLILMRNQYPLIVVPMKLREEYYGVLSQADVNEFEPLVAYFGKLLKHSLEIQLKGIKGEDISDPDDIHKEIELFVKGFGKKETIHERRTDDNILLTIKSSISPLFYKCMGEFKKFDSLFIDNSNHVGVFRHVHGSILQESYTYHKFNSNIENIEIDDSLITLGRIDSIKFTYCWNGFNKTNKHFNLKNNLSITFNEYDYQINDWKTKDLVYLKKLYHEQLSNEEIERIVNSHLRIILKDIKDKSK